MSVPTSNSPAPAWEAVHLITNFFDHPLEGLADCDGKPHVFFLREENPRAIPQAEDADPEEEEMFEIDTVYGLYPASDEMVADMREKQAIFERWHQAYKSGAATIKDHPALLDERPRYQALSAKLKPILDQLRASPPAIACDGNFARGRRPVPQGCSDWGSFEVQWKR